jgi:catechol 2,3-dioxygenase-like lactoylglutathione lyase family enzyme
MKFWSGVVTEKLEASKAFYVKLFGCNVIFDSEWFVLLQLGPSELGFMVPGLEEQAPIFRPAFQGQGLWVTVDVEDVDAEYERIQSLGVEIELALRDEAWGDRHFVVVDPNGIGVDIVQRRLPPGGA